MKKYEIDEAIAEFKECAENNRVDLDLSFAEENEQVARWLIELKEFLQLEKEGRLLILPSKLSSIEIDKVKKMIEDLSHESDKEQISEEDEIVLE